MEDAVTKVPYGHYELPLPFILDNPRLPDHRYQEEKRAGWLRKKLLKNDQLYKDYVDFVRGIISKGFAKIVEKLTGGWFIPHHEI